MRWADEGSSSRKPRPAPNSLPRLSRHRPAQERPFATAHPKLLPGACISRSTLGRLWTTTRLPGIGGTRFRRAGTLAHTNHRPTIRPTHPQGSPALATSTINSGPRRQVTLFRHRPHVQAASVDAGRSVASSFPADACRSTALWVSASTPPTNGPRNKASSKNATSTSIRNNPSSPPSVRRDRLSITRRPIRRCFSR